MNIENLTNIRIKWKKIINYGNEKSIADTCVTYHFRNAKYFNFFDLVCLAMISLDWLPIIRMKKKDGKNYIFYISQEHFL